MESDEPPLAEGSVDDSQEIEVLLVDDNEQWVTYLANNIEDVDPTVDVTVALSANEAMVTLGDREDLDCVVADYRMPEVDGLQLLDRIRADNPHLPFILMTAAGSEEIASTAIDAGVTDYLVKNPKVDQTSLLVRRIRSAYDRYALRTALEESEERYRTVTEQTWDAIVVLEGDHIAFCNERMAELTGQDRGALNGTAFVDTFVHEADATGVDEFLAGGDETDQLHEARLVVADESVRHVELTRRRLGEGEGAAVLVSIRDITDRKRRQQRLNRERSLNRAVMNVLIEARTRDELETAIVDCLGDHGYGLVWIGEAVGDTIEARAATGGTDYVDWLTDLSADERPDDEPSLVSVRTGEMQLVDDVSDLFPTVWRDRLLDAGYHSVAALPIAYDDIVYGLLAVYHSEPHFVDDSEVELLGEFAETIAFAVHHLETHKTLAAETVLSVELTIPADEHYLHEAITEASIDVSELDATVVGTHTGKDDTVVQYVTLSETDLQSVVDSIDNHPTVEAVAVIQEAPPHRLQVTLSDSPPERTLIARGAIMLPTIVTPGSVTIRFEVPSREGLGDIVDALEAGHGEVTVQSFVDVDRDVTPDAINRVVDLEDLTDKQHSSLKAAFHHGYFEQPRSSSATEIAESLEVTHSTYLQHLRSAQRKLLQQLFGDDRAD